MDSCKEIKIQENSLNLKDQKIKDDSLCLLFKVLILNDRFANLTYLDLSCNELIKDKLIAEVALKTKICSINLNQNKILKADFLLKAIKIKSSLKILIENNPIKFKEKFFLSNKTNSNNLYRKRLLDRLNESRVFALNRIFSVNNQRESRVNFTRDSISTSPYKHYEILKESQS